MVNQNKTSDKNKLKQVTKQIKTSDKKKQCQQQHHCIQPLFGNCTNIV